MKWTRGRAMVDQLLAWKRGRRRWHDMADVLLESAKPASARNPEAAYELAYDAARKASEAEAAISAAAGDCPVR